jgi:hypothetical protein
MEQLHKITNFYYDPNQPIPFPPLPRMYLYKFQQGY